MADDATEYRPGDNDNNILRKILQRIKLLIFAVTENNTPVIGPITISTEDIEIGAIEVKDSSTDNRARIETIAPAAGDAGLVVRNIPSGVQEVTVDNFPATQPVSGTVAVSNFPATQPVSGSVSVSNFPATQPVSGTVGVSNFPATQPVSATQLPAALVGGRLDANVGAWLGSTVPTVGQKTMANSVPVTIALDQNSPGFVDPFLQAKRFGILIGKTAVGYHVMGRRSGANSTSILQDCGEFLGTSIDTFPELTGVEALEVVSSSANDTAAGTGTRTLQITYMDTSNNLVVSSPITMNGVTPVSLGALRAKFIYWMEAVTGGTLETGAGNILLRIAGGGATQEQISANANRSLSCRFAVPAGFTAYISFWQASGAGGGTFDVRLRGTTFADGITLSTRYLFKDNCLIGTAGGDITNEIPWLSFASLARIKCSALYSAAAPANRLDCDMSILLIAN